MAGKSLHVALNAVNPVSYAGWPGTLSGCLNDAAAMQAICKEQGFDVKTLLSEKATAEGLLGAIDDTARDLQPGDLLTVTFSGHGAQMRDPWGIYGMVDTLCLFDRQVIGHELSLLWATFRPGVKVLFLSDSCHSGTVTRSTPPTDTESKLLPPEKVKTMPPDIQALVEVQHRYLYRSIFKGMVPPVPSCPVLLISGCQSNQFSLDGNSNGLFTEKVLEVWNAGKFAGDYPLFHKEIVKLMPPYQTPAYFPTGPDDPKFTGSRPFTF